jgi:S1-C subfamily serine protease
MPGVVQTDCTIYPGDSGGPLFDMYGRVIAIHTAIATSAAENYHVAISEFFETWSDLVGPPERPPAYCGLSVAVDAAGCRVDKVEKESPAANAGLRAGDLVLKVDGRRIEIPATFERWLAESRTGETLHVDIKRGNKLLSVPIKLQSQPQRKK